MSRATVGELVHAAKVVAAQVGADRGSYCFGGRIAVPVEDRWALAISADDAGRLRIEACFDGAVVATLWALAGNDDRLAMLAAAARDEAAALAV